MFKLLKRANKELQESPAINILADAFWSLVYGMFFLSSVIGGQVGWAIATGIILALNIMFFVFSSKEYKKKYSN